MLRQLENGYVDKDMAIETEIRDLISLRAATHGGWSETARVAQSIKNAMGSSPNWTQLTDSHREGLDMIAQKIARILTGDPNEDEHWIDIAGYVALIRRDLA